MKYLKLYEEFRLREEELVEEPEIDTEVSDTTIDDVLNPDFFKDVEVEKEEEGDVSVDSNGVYSIKNWNVY